jgi:hypothetical protein
MISNILYKPRFNVLRLAFNARDGISQQSSLRMHERSFSVFSVVIFYPFPSVSQTRKVQNKHTYVRIETRVVPREMTVGGFKYHPVVSLTMGCLVSPSEIHLLSGFPNWIPISPNREERESSESKDSPTLVCLFFLCTFHLFNIARSILIPTITPFILIRYYGYFLRFNQSPHSL